MSGPYWGKYRGTVEKTDDPLGLGRVQVQVPGVLGKGTSSWAMPCVPYAGKGVGLWAVPPEGAHVWVEFEGGNAGAPILAGCYWAAGEAPAPTPKVVVLKTSAGSLTLSESDKTVTLEFEGKKVILSASTIEVTNGSSKVVLEGASVKVNDGALEVT